jgi:6-phosphofructokinase
MKRIGMLTSGGDCQALNAAMRGVVKGLSENVDELEVYGFLNGYKGLIYGDYRLLTSADFSGILTKGGTILGSSRQPFKQMRVPDANGLDKVEAMKATYHKLNLDCLVILGGNGTQKTANLLREEGLNIIHLPKTIDNDIYGTDVTFGFQSAINIATDCIDCIHTTAASHNRVFIVEVMGHKVGWLTLYAGVAGGADIILLPEIPYDIEKDCRDQQAHEGRKRIYHTCGCRGSHLQGGCGALQERVQGKSGKAEISVCFLRDCRPYIQGDRRRGARDCTGSHTARRKPMSV